MYVLGDLIWVVPFICSVTWDIFVENQNKTCIDWYFFKPPVEGKVPAIQKQLPCSKPNLARLQAARLNFLETKPKAT